MFLLSHDSYPEVQRKAQEEIDRVVRSDRLPGFQDRENLPFVDAILKEVLRWHPVAPMGVPHTTTEDDVYDGYFIPKGAVLLPTSALDPRPGSVSRSHGLQARTLPRTHQRA